MMDSVSLKGVDIYVSEDGWIGVEGKVPYIPSIWDVLHEQVNEEDGA